MQRSNEGTAHDPAADAIPEQIEAGGSPGMILQVCTLLVAPTRPRQIPAIGPGGQRGRVAGVAEEVGGAGAT